AIGVTWVVLQPLLTMGVFTLFFGRLAKLPSDGLPYPVFYFSALVPWTYFATALQSCTAVVVENQRVITKVFFPRLVLPLSAVVSGLVDFSIGFLVLGVVLAIYGMRPGLAALWLPVLMLLAVLTALGVGLWMSALNALYRDVRYVVPFLVQIWMFASPVAYPSSLVPPRWRGVYGLNPMAGVIDGFRWAVTGQNPPSVAMLDVLARAAKAAFRRRSGGNRNGRAHIWALREVSFDVREGETIGIIGRNGAGKSTLLKILAGITLPTEGWAEVRGRVGSLLEVGTGFHPELTGRENIYFSGSILGMKKREIDRKFDEITAFSGVETFLDTPLKHYSSGMQLRLAFSVAAHLEPEVLLVDEVLAVGDLEFQKKCLGKMEEVTRGGRTVLFVSHNMGAVRRICARGVWLEGGAVRRVGTAGECVDAYTASVEAAAEAGTGVYDLRARKDRFGSGFVLLRELRLLNSENQPRASVAFGEPFTLVFEFECLRATPSSFVGLTVLGADGTSVLGSHHYDSAEMRPLPPGSGRFGRLADARPAYVQPVLEWKWE